MHKHTKPALYRARSTFMVIAVMVATGLTLSAPALHAKPKHDNDEVWSEWKAMGNAYVARRRQPPKLNEPKADRRQANVQVRLEKLIKNKSKLLAKLENLSNDDATNSIQAQQRGNNNIKRKAVNPAKIQKQLYKLDKQIAKLTKRQNKHSAKGGNRDKSPALWLHTGEEGLYAITIAELATKTDKAEKKLRNNAKKGKLNLSTAKHLDSETADQAVSWHYDKATDSILFAAQAYDTFYSDENAYQFKLGGKKARPMTVANGPAPVIGSEMPFRDTLKFEEEPDLFFATWAVAAEPNADYWYWDILFGEFIPEINVDLSIPDPANTGWAQLRITLRGWTEMNAGNDHEVWAEMNGTPVGSSIIWDAFDEVVLIADFDQSLLDASGNNTLTLRNNSAAGITSGQWLDQVEIDYLRKPVAFNDRLWMHDVSAGTQTVSGFSSENIVVVESLDELSNLSSFGSSNLSSLGLSNLTPDGSSILSSDASSILRKDVHIEPDGLGGWKVIFDADGGTDFLITERNAAGVASITVDNRAKLRNRKNNADYLIIAPRDFAATAEALAAYRSSRFGFVKIAWLDDIYNEFSAGRADPLAIGRFMHRVTEKWNTVPTTAVLAGKGSLDQLDRMGYADSFLPVLMSSTPWALAASDSKLLGFEDDTPFTIGRLPITNDSEGLDYVAKLTDYESTIPGSERYEAVLVADNPDKAGDFHTNSDLLTTRLLDTLGFDRVAQLYHPDTDVRAYLTDTATWNTGYISYDGHGSTEQVGNSTENYITSSDASLLANASYPVFTALTCAAGDDTLPGTRSLASALVLNPQGGAIASVAPTGLSLDRDAQLLGNAFVDSLFGSNETIGGALLDAKLATSTSISEFMPRMYSVIGEPDVYAR